MIYVTQFVVILNESEYFTLYSANQQREKVKTKLEIVIIIIITTTGNSNQPKEDSTQKHGDNATVGEHDQTSRGNGNLSPLLVELNQRTRLLRKELKIKGQIAEAHQRDKLTYVSLIHQINEVQEACYDDSEIVNSVIKAMSLSLTLRNVLETT